MRIFRRFTGLVFIFSVSIFRCEGEIKNKMTFFIHFINLLYNQNIFNVFYGKFGNLLNFIRSKFNGNLFTNFYALCLDVSDLNERKIFLSVKFAVI